MGVEIVSILVFSLEDWEKDKEETNLILKILKANFEGELQGEYVKKYKIIFYNTVQM